ncbi:adenosine receptor A3-like [Haliotis rubra]|uniref:adenosine receptor A3-like n=1 Tax=Haliotis rubra TaxID=36100 RepID=UPI001EE5EB83|nr:adenosine receptor A3-like [Haliotis rubra]
MESTTAALDSSPDYSLNSTYTKSNTSSVTESGSGLNVVDAVVIVMQILMAVVIIGGNVLTILAVKRTPRLHTVPNMYVVSLAVADLIVGIVLPFYAIKMFPGMENLYNQNKYLCLSHPVLLIVSAGCSIVSMVVISVDRLIYIVRPLRYEYIATARRARIIIGTTWCGCIFYGTLPLYYNTFDGVKPCELFNILHMEYQLYGQVTIFCVCCVVAGASYGYIFKISYHQRKAMLDVTRQSIDTDTRAVVSTFKREWPMIKMFVLVFGVFFVCWCPAIVGIVLGNTVGIEPTTMNLLVLSCLLNSGMNFIIYGVKNQDFRRAYCLLLCSKRISYYERTDTENKSASGNELMYT